jgi:hypothetical protein
MIRVFNRSGSQEVQLSGKAVPDEAWPLIRRNAARLLQARNQRFAATLLEEIPFELWDGTNGFGDEFSLLYYQAPLDRYVKIAEQAENPKNKNAFTEIAEALTEIGHFIRFIAIDLASETGPEPVSSPSLEIRSDAVERALSDAEQLIHSRGASSGVDRVHTALHGYLKVVATKAKIEVDEDASITTIFKGIREKHPGFATPSPGRAEVDRVVRAMATIVDALNPLRNRASGAHPNETVLNEPEAMLVINSARTLLHYLDSKLH